MSSNAHTIKISASILFKEIIRNVGKNVSTKKFIVTLTYSSEILEKPKHTKYFAIIQPTKVMSEYLT